MGVIAERIHQKLTEAFSPSRLDVVDDSGRHAGHSGASEAGESHFNVLVESEQFIGQSRLTRQRMINRILAEELAGPVHALSLKAIAPGEPG
jgi:BolA protein